MLDEFFHFNITVSNIEASIAFYQSLGFVLRERVAPQGDDLAPHLGQTITALQAAILVPPSGKGPMLDLVEYDSPASHGQPYPALNHVGIARVALRVSDFAAAHHRLVALGVPFVGEAVTYPGPGGTMLRTVCFRDPDGTCVQIIGAAQS